MTTTESIKLPVLRAPGFAELPKRRKLFVSTPMYGGMCTHTYAIGLAYLAAQLPRHGIDVEFSVAGGEALITRARNRATAEFLNSDCTHMLCIDADVGFRPDDVASLIMADEDVVCGAYPMKKINWKALKAAVEKGMPVESLAREAASYPINLFPDALAKGEVTAIRRNGRTYIEVQDAATGFLLISREIVVKIIEAFGKSLEYTTDYEPFGATHWKVFHADSDPTGEREVARSALEMAAIKGDIEELKAAAIAYAASLERPSARYLSEDYWFSRLAQMVGAKIWLCTDIELTHMGAYIFRGNLERVIPYDRGSRDASQKSPWKMQDFSEPPTSGMYSREWYRSHYEFEADYRAVARVLGTAFDGLPVHTVMDVGCGVGLVIDEMRTAGWMVFGVEPQRNALAEMPVGVRHTILQKLSDWPGGKLPLVLCMEVAEHVPAAEGDALVEQLCRVGEVIVFTAATPGQGGHGHVNEQPPEYWTERFAKFGRKVDDAMTLRLVSGFSEAAPRMPWLGRNVMCFR